MMPSCSGLIFPTSRYIRSRQVQKLSLGLPATSASPAIARWKAWECRLGMPGSSGPLSRSAPSAVESAWIRVSMPSALTSRRTWLAHPLGSSARSAKKADMVQHPIVCYLYIHIQTFACPVNSGKLATFIQ
ncbi:hypothetical protein EMIT0P260_20340 [Pseudomonas sp. IT-P260]